MPVLPTAFSPATVSRVALASAVANGLIVVTGGAVRLTGSGLGCPTWPRCRGPLRACERRGAAWSF